MKISLVTLAILLSLQMYSWESKGHKLVAEIARHYMTPKAISSVQHYLGTMSFEDASVWMDDVKDEERYKFMKVWHYVNVEKDKTYVATKEPNVINALNTTLNDLANKGRTDTEINNSIKLLFHLVGDIHQPLHCGYIQDRGGNDIEVIYQTHTSKLHSVWDKEIIKSADITLEKCLAVANALSKEERSKIEKTDVMLWMGEARVFLDGIYDFKDKQIDQKYINKNSVVITKQLVKAGIRLAKILNDNFL